MTFLVTCLAILALSWAFQKARDEEEREARRRINHRLADRI